MRPSTFLALCAFITTGWLLFFWQLGAFERLDPYQASQDVPDEESDGWRRFKRSRDVESPVAGLRPEQDPATGAWAPGRLVAREVITEGDVLIDPKLALLTLRFAIDEAAAGPHAVEFVTRIPRSIPGRLTVTAAHFDPEPSGIYAAGDGLYAIYHWQGAVRDAKIRQRFELEVVNRSGLRNARREELELEEEDDAETWLSPEEHVESDDEAIVALASRLTRRDAGLTLAAISEDVVARLRPAGRKGNRGAVRLLGDEVDATRLGYCDLFVALARANGIPARVVEGFATEAGSFQHDWVEVKMPRSGWRIIDPWAIEAGEADLETFRGLRIPLAFRTRDPRLGGYHVSYLHGASDTQLTSWSGFTWRYRLTALE